MCMPRSLARGRESRECVLEKIGKKESAEK